MKKMKNNISIGTRRERQTWSQVGVITQLLPNYASYITALNINALNTGMESDVRIA